VLAVIEQPWQREKKNNMQEDIESTAPERKESGS
jgi:hypothetical protein